MTSILGISAFYHDSAAALVVDGKIISAAQEERFTRKKNDSSYPKNAINYVLSEYKLKLNEVDYVVFYEKPFLKFERLIETYISFVPKGFRQFLLSMPLWLSEKLFLKWLLLSEIRKIASHFDQNKIMFSEHHYSHAASAFFPSPFEEAVVLTLDGVGEWVTTSVCIGKSNNLKIVKEIHFPHSLGLLYSAFTYYLGFKVNEGEYKVMGLAPYGIPKYKDIILDKIVNLKEDGSFYLEQSYFNYSTGLTMISKKFISLFGQPIRSAEQELEQFHMDVAASIQTVTEYIILKITRSLFSEYKIPNLCMAGGVALNCVANGKIIKDNYFKNIWVQPAAGDSGAALGAAIGFWFKKYKAQRSTEFKDQMSGSYLGPSFSNECIKDELEKLKAKYKFFTDKYIFKIVAQEISHGKVVGWFQGRMEFGPRSLGARSILADPRSNIMQKKVNLKIKFRESFRPFAPAILRDDLNDWFENNIDSPYMMIVDQVKKEKRHNLNDKEKKLSGLKKLYVQRSDIPAVTHVDYTARVQTVHENTNKKFYSLIKQFKDLTGCPILLNTSFNIRGEPIVCSPKDAYKCFMSTDIDLLVIGNYIIKKEDQK